MFQTEPILYLQSLGNEWITYLMILVSTMGSPSFLVATIIIATFGIDFKKGILLFQLLLWTSLITTVLKILIAFPRPDFVDNRVLNLESEIKNTSPFNGNSSERFLNLPDDIILKAFRLQETFTKSPFGFPSGHVALTAALWGGVSAMFGNNTVRKTMLLAIIIMAFSRMYLGRHFLGDVLGGAITGLILLIIFTHFLNSSLKDDFFKKESFRLTLIPQNLLFYSFMFIIPILLTAFSLVTSDITGFMLGINLAYVLIIRKGIPESEGNMAQKIMRILIASSLFGVSYLVLSIGFQTTETINYLQFSLTEFLKTFIPSLTIWLSVVVCKKLDLYKRDSEIHEP